MKDVSVDGDEGLVVDVVAFVELGSTQTASWLGDESGLV